MPRIATGVVTKAAFPSIRDGKGRGSPLLAGHPRFEEDCQEGHSLSARTYLTVPQRDKSSLTDCPNFPSPTTFPVIYRVLLVHAHAPRFTLGASPLVQTARSLPSSSVSPGTRRARLTRRRVLVEATMRPCVSSPSRSMARTMVWWVTRHSGARNLLTFSLLSSALRLGFPLQNIARDHMEKIHKEFPWISYGDLWTLAGVAAIQETNGPKIPWRPGRIDGFEHHVTPDGRLPDASKAQDHLRDIFYRMG